MIISIIAAMDRNRVIGKDNDLPWHLPNDLKRFKALTMGKPIIMGRKTHESIGRALPGRRNIIITTQADYEAEGCEVVHTFNDALTLAEGSEEVMVIGGASIYALAFARAERMYLTRIDADVQGDVYFPTYKKDVWTEVFCEDHDADENHAFPYSYLILEEASFRGQPVKAE